jgi:hypothetical protein
MTGTCTVCGQEVKVGRGRKLRPHLVNPKDPSSAVCPGRDPGQLPPRLPNSKAKPSQPRKRKKMSGNRSVHAILAGAFESNRRRH